MAKDTIKLKTKLKADHTCKCKIIKIQEENINPLDLAIDEEESQT